MAVYYKDNGAYVTLSNTQESGYTLWDGSAVCAGKIASVSLTDGKFVFPSNANGLFWSCTNTIFRNISSWDTSNCTSFNSLFYDCQNLKTIDVSGFNTNKIAILDDMFGNCTSLTTITGISNWNTSTASSSLRIFSGCSSLTSLDLSGWSFYDAHCLYGYMFSGCSSLTSLITTPGSWHMNFHNSSIQSMFEGCSSMKSIDLSFINPGDPSYTTVRTSLSSAFKNCTSLESINFGNWGNSPVEDISYAFYGCENLKTLNWTNYSWNLIRIQHAFEGSGLTEIDFTNKNVEIRNATDAFANCPDLTTIIFPSLSYSSTATVDGMFRDCPNLESIYVEDNTDWISLTGSNLFTNDTKLPTWDGVTDLTRANTARYFKGRWFPKLYSAYEKDSENWSSANVYIKFNNVWTVVEVYV